MIKINSNNSSLSKNTMKRITNGLEKHEVTNMVKIDGKVHQVIDIGMRKFDTNDLSRFNKYKSIK